MFTNPWNRAEVGLGGVRTAPRMVRRLRLLAIASVILAGQVAALSLWLTAPLTPSPTTNAVAPASRPVSTPPVAKHAEPAWPDERLDGEPAKRRLLALLQSAERKLTSVDGYTAVFRKRERLKGSLGPEQTLTLKVRHEPFSIYMKFLAPKEGKEVVYVEGRNDGKLIAHNGDWTRRLIPRLTVKPTDALALADSRHPITEAGLLNLVRKLVGFRKLDLNDLEAVTILDRIRDAEGREWLRSLHTHPIQHPERPFAKVEVLYDPKTLLPRKITGYDWPVPGDNGELKLSESYTYDEVDLDAQVDDSDFDPANPEYAFTRY